MSQHADSHTAKSKCMGISSYTPVQVRPNCRRRSPIILQQKFSPREVIQFPNENIFIKLNSSARGQDVFVIQTTSSPVHYNLMELLIMIQTIRLDSAARITAVVPYLCYGRSDKKDQPRVPITARLVADMIESAGADRYMTLDPHAGQIQGFFSIPGDVLTASHMISEHIRDHMLSADERPGSSRHRPGFCQEGTQLRPRSRPADCLH
jgi:ribose-phosphate pyrophosphokinase